MIRRAAPLLACLLLTAHPLLAKKPRARVQSKSVQPAPIKTIVLDPTDGPEALEEALREARGKGPVRVVVLPEVTGTASSLAPRATGAYLPSDVQVNDPSYDGFPSSFRAEPSIAAQGDAVVCVFNDSGYDSASPNPSPVGLNTDGFSISADRGASWHDQGKRAPAGTFTAFNGDNIVAAGPDGDFYYFSDGGKRGGYWNAMAAARSTDGGRTWTAPSCPSENVVGRPDGFFDKGWIAVDRSSTATRGNVYVTWSDFGNTGTDLYFSRSTDQGVTWSAQRLDRFSHPVAVTYVQVAPNGLVYVGEQDEGTITNDGFTGTNYVRVSADGGRTFTSLRSAGAYRSVGNADAMALCGDPTFFGGLVRYLNGPIEADSSLRIAVDPSDASGQTVFVTTQALPQTPGDDSDVLLWRSTDGGLNWAEPVRVNDDTTKTDQFMPDLWVAPDGTVGVLWLDRRNDLKANWRLEAWMALSTDHGKSFGCSFPVSSRSFPPVGRCQMSDYNAVFADENGFVLAWGDSRQVDPQKQMVFAIYGATVPVGGPGPVLAVDEVRVDPTTPSRFLVRLRNDGTADATGLWVAVSIDGNQILAPIVSVRFPDVPACHGTAEAVITAPWAVSTPDLRGRITVTGPLGSASLPFSAPKGVSPGGVLLSADFHSGLGDFSADNGSLWRATQQCSGSGGAIAFFGSDMSCGYSSGTRIYGALTSKIVSLPPGAATLRFREAVGIGQRWGSDRMLVQISTDGGVSFESLYGFGYMCRYAASPSLDLVDSSGNPTWHDVTLDVSDYGGNEVVIRFFAYVGARPGRGWAVDDVRLTSVTAVPSGAPGTCASPQEISTASPGELVVDLSSSSASTGDPAPSCGDGSLHHPYFTTFTPPVDGTYAFSACSLGGAGVLSAWSGSCGALSQLGCTPVGDCNAPGGRASLEVSGQAGVPIHVLLSSASASTPGLVRLTATAHAEGTLVPIVLDVPAGTAHYTTELALTNHAADPASLTITYTPAIGTGSGSVTPTLAAGNVLLLDDVIAWLRAGGVPIPPSSVGPQAGTLRVVAEGVRAGSVSAVARTLTPTGTGAASLAYAAVPMTGATRTTVFGLRTSPQDRSNLAVYNPSLDPVTFRVTAVSGAGDGRRVVVREAETLPAGGWTQYDGVLVPAGMTNGWVVVERTSSAGTATAYGVVNDHDTNDGSFLPPVASGGSSAALTVPVLVETPRYTSELVLANRGSTDATLTLRYIESLDGSGGAADVTFALPSGTQRIIPGAIDYLRQKGGTMGPAGRSYAGALRIEVAGAAPGDVWAAARANAAAPGGGAFGLFVPAVQNGDEASDSGTIDGLRADSANRSNVAVLNAGSDFAGAVTLRLQAFDGATGTARGAPVDVTLPPGRWAQPQDFFAASGAAKGWVTVTRTSGSAPWIAYGVVNDGAQPGQRTDDGAYVAMRR